MPRLNARAVAPLFAVIFAALALPAAAEGPSHGLAMHGEPALGADFEHFPYADPDAPKGGRLNYAVSGSFDSLNPFIVQGDASRGLFDQFFGYNVFETLMARSRDEPFTLYPLIAESVETDEDRTFVEFTLDADARFSDGEPIRAQDVIFSMELLAEKGRPLYRNWIGLVEKMEIVGERGVRFTFKETADREIPLLLALLPVLPEHATNVERFDRSTLTPMVGSGPYVISEVRPGEFVHLSRNPDYWARDHPSKTGLDNFDEIRVTYFRDDNAMFQAFQRGLVDIFQETSSSRWATGYDFPAARDGRVIQENFEIGLPSGMYGFVLNTRRPQFADIRLRRAIAGLLDFEWINQNLFSGAYVRTRSFYDGSELSSHGVPASEAELALLGDYAETIPAEILDGTWAPPASDGSGRDRAFMRAAMELFAEAGYRVDGGRLLGPDGRQLSFEIMLNGPSAQPLAMAWQRTLERVGIAVSIRVVDSAQYLQRQRTYDFDVMLMTYTSSLSPGAEQIMRWGSEARDLDGTFNFAGAADPAIDALIQSILSARTREDFVTAVRAYDRVLLAGAYVVPLYHQPEQWVARQNYIRHPGATPVYGPQFPTWWHDRAN
ncbi:ABC transporter substrate-binding protein [Chelativorans sp. ZYF759]|uniref:extracellular solute-binding protein n=1 Tax=Chelativorans sp. ZYF759 TaxID=2692213 RepID=UPI00145C95DD|nr:extracellular solute-binding protein [Chelativorans sp. ZYF759]NMG38677.1 ABC transporter substrate-binding protein [Chelativorans sp. ZYF759]